MGGYDLYGTYYPNINDAINAEMAQCAEIDNRINSQKILSIEKSMHGITKQYEYQIAELKDYIAKLEQRITELNKQ